MVAAKTMPLTVDVGRFVPDPTKPCYSPGALRAANLLLNASRGKMPSNGVRKPRLPSRHAVSAKAPSQMPHFTTSAGAGAAAAAAAAAAVQQAMATVHAAQDQMKHFQVATATAPDAHGERHLGGGTVGRTGQRAPNHRRRSQAGSQHEWDGIQWRLPAAAMVGMTPFQFPVATGPWTPSPRGTPAPPLTPDKCQSMLRSSRPVVAHGGMLAMIAAVESSGSDRYSGDDTDGPTTPLVSDSDE